MCVCATDRWEGNGEKEERREEGDSHRVEVRYLEIGESGLRLVRVVCWIGESCLRSVRGWIGESSLQSVTGFCDRWRGSAIDNGVLRSVRGLCWIGEGCLRSVLGGCWIGESGRSRSESDFGELGYFCVWMREFFFFFCYLYRNLKLRLKKRSTKHVEVAFFKRSSS